MGSASSLMTLDRYANVPVSSYGLAHDIFGHPEAALKGVAAGKPLCQWLKCAKTCQARRADLRHH